MAPVSNFVGSILSRRHACAVLLGAGFSTISEAGPTEPRDRSTTALGKFFDQFTDDWVRHQPSLAKHFAISVERSRTNSTVISRRKLCNEEDQQLRGIRHGGDGQFNSECQDRSLVQYRPGIPVTAYRIRYTLNPDASNALLTPARENGVITSGFGRIDAGSRIMLRVTLSCLGDSGFEHEGYVNSGMLLGKHPQFRYFERHVRSG